MLEFILLCHERELAKKSNTGQLLLDVPGVSVRQVVWARKQPDEGILEALENRRCWLVYPLTGGDGEAFECVAEAQQKDAVDDQLSARLGAQPSVILIDATWQQAQKMVNQSPYLQMAPRLALTREPPSLFRLRRNQRRGGLCTVECAIELLYLNGERTKARELHEKFLAFMAQPRH